MKIAVLGAGIIGISSALAIQQRVPNCEITIISSQFSPNTTSDVAAGLIEPYLCDDDPDKIIKWTKATIHRIQEYMADGQPGAEEMSGYWLQSTQAVPKWLEVMKNVSILKEHELEQVAKRQEHKFGVFYTTWYLEPTAYLQWSSRKFLKNGGKFETQIFESKKEIEDDVATKYDLIVNCTGFGAKELFGDEELRAVRGQVMRVKCPRVKHFFIDDHFYALLNDSCLILGGTAEPSTSLIISQSTASKIFAGNCHNIPSLKSAEILSHHVGLRPSRPTVRLEVDTDTFRRVPIVHNYGHGGSGITLHWGCAQEVALLVEQLVGKARL